MGPFTRTLLAVLLVIGTPAVARAQVFFASEPHPKFAIGPLVVVATVRPDLGPINVSLLWSVVRLPGDRAVGAIKQDMYLLWPGEIVVGGGISAVGSFAVDVPGILIQVPMPAWLGWVPRL